MTSSDHNEDEIMAKVEIYTKDYCPYCMRAKHLLTTKGVSFEEFDITNDAEPYGVAIARSCRAVRPRHW